MIRLVFRKVSQLTVSLLGLTLILNGPDAKAADLRDPSQADTLVKRLLKALHYNDLGAIYEMDFNAQEERSAIRADSPHFLADKRLDEHLSKWRRSFTGYGEIWRFAKLDPETKVIEIKPHTARQGPGAYDVYVSMKFASVERAPFITPLNTDFKGHILKEAVVQIVFSDSGLVAHSSRVVEADVLFADVPFKIVGMSVRPRNFLEIYVVGGKPPYESKTYISGYPIESLTPRYITQNSNTIRISNYYESFQQTPLRENTPNLSGTLTVSDTANHRDVVAFRFEDFVDTIIYSFARDSWFDNSSWQAAGLFYKPDRVSVLRPATAEEVQRSAGKGKIPSDVKSALLGTWRYERCCLVTYRPNGTKLDKYDNGLTTNCTWRLDGNALTISELDGSGLAKTTFKVEILELTDDTFAAVGPQRTTFTRNSSETIACLRSAFRDVKQNSRTLAGPGCC